MANGLTGDFDVVAEFAVPAVNRVLAAMHLFERFPHSLTARVDDNPPPGSRPKRPTVVGLIDAFGDAVADHSRIGMRLPLPGLLDSSSAPHGGFDAVVNLDILGVNVGPVVPSHLQGRAQVQLSPPAIELAGTSGTSITMRLEMVCRYFPDPGTAPAAEFVRGELRITAAVNQTASQVANVVAIDIDADTAQIALTPHWSSKPLSAEDRAGIDLLMRNALKTSFLPSNITLPANILHARFKTLSGGAGAVALMLDMVGAPGNPASVHDVFLGTGDDFAFAIGVDFVRTAFQPTIDKMLTTSIDPVSIGIATYTIALSTVTLDLLSGKMVMTIQGRATTPSWPPNFNFTFRQEFTLAANGPTAELVVGNLSFDTSSIVVNVAKWIVDRFTGRAATALAKVRDKALWESDARGTVERVLSAEENLGPFLRALLNPTGGRPVRDHRPSRFAYTSAEIRPSGIALHGSLTFRTWLPPRVEYEQVPANGQIGGGGHAIGGGVARSPDYSALNSWIPGGTIQRYEWKSQGQSGPGFTDDNKFIFFGAPTVVIEGVDSSNLVSGYSPLCLTVHGTRLSSSGPVADEAVIATVCGYNSFPIVTGVGVAFEDTPLVALAQPGPDGMVEVVGHAAARVHEIGSPPPNLIIHFLDETSTGDVSVFPRALAESGRRDAATAVVVVTPPGQLVKTRHSAGVTYAEDADGNWKRRFGVPAGRGPMTLIVDPGGKVTWKHEGQLEQRTLEESLRKNLAERRPVRPDMIPAKVRIGQPPPNFLFEYVPGRELTLRKVVGRAAVLVFWRSSSQASVEAVRDLEKSMGHETLLLAIADGEDVESAGTVAAEAGHSATIVPDPNRQISLAYGVTMWPTIIVIDAFGVVRAIHYGRDRQGISTSQADRTVSAKGSSAK